MIQFDQYFSNGLKPPTNWNNHFCSKDVQVPGLKDVFVHFEGPFGNFSLSQDEKVSKDKHSLRCSCLPAYIIEDMGWLIANEKVSFLKHRIVVMYIATPLIWRAYFAKPWCKQRLTTA